MSTIKLHPVNRGKNKWCGPAALSILTGENTDDCARFMRSISGQKRAMGFHTWVLCQALRKLGIVSITISRYGVGRHVRPTFAQWRRQFRPVDVTYLIVVGCHFAIVQGRRYVCSHVNKLVRLSQAPRQRARVTEVYALSWNGKPLKRIDPVPPKPADPHRQAHSKAIKLARAEGIEIEREEDKFYIWCPRLENEEDPYYGDHYVFDWGEVLERVKGYVEKINETFRSLP